MSNKTKKQEEKTSWKAFIDNCNNPFVKRLCSCTDVSRQNQERPDMILSDFQVIYAIEHISIPLLKIENGSAEKIRHADSVKVYNKYFIDEEKGINNLEGHTEEALSGVENIVNKQLEAVSNFSHEDFINTLKTLLNKHDANDYLNNVSALFPGKRIKVFFLLDLSQPEVFTKGLVYRRTDGLIEEFSIRKDFPFTTAFINILKSVKCVDSFFIVWHPVNSYNKKNTRCYSFDPNNKDWRSQGIPQVWGSFRLPVNNQIRKKVKLILED